MCEEININVNETNETINIVSTEIVEVIDVNVAETVEEVTFNITEEIIQVNINKITGGGGEQTLAETLVLGNTTDGENISISDGDAIILDNGSMLKKGTIDAGNGGSGGISQICGVGFEHKWEAGRLYIMNSNGNIIREVSHNFTIIPTTTDDITKGFVQDTRWILDNGDVYVCTDPTENAAVWELQVTQVNSDWDATSGVEEILNKPTIPDAQIQSDWTQANTSALDYIKNKPTIPSAGVTSVGLTMPSAFSVTNSPITSSGDIAVTGAGLVSQYVRGDGTLANFPTSTGGGSSVNYYLNGSVSQGTFGGTTYYQMSKTPILGAGTNFTRTNGQGNGYIASFITDAGDPSFLNIPGGNWNLEFYFQSSSTGGSPQFYGEIYKVSATNVFTLVASGSVNPEGITNGTTVDQYFTSVSVPQTSLLVTDRLAIRIYVITSGRTITLHTENGNLCEVLTTFTTGLTALNGLTQQVQYFDEGTSGTDFNISSATDTHTFNLPTASATNRGALSSADWSTFNGKQNALGFTAENVANKENTTLDTSTSKYPTNRLVKEYADAKVADSITDGVTTIAPSQNAVFDALALKQDALIYKPYKFIGTRVTAHTGTVAETIVATATIPGGTFNSSDVMKVIFGANKATTAVGSTQRLRINTSNTLTGSVIVGVVFSTVASVTILKRNFMLNGGNLYGLNFTLNNTVTDESNTLTTYSSTPFNTSNTLYLFFTIQLGTITDSVTPNLFNIIN